MQIFGQDWSFWVATIGAALIKLFSSPYHSVLRTVFTVGAAIFCAVVFTTPTLDWLNLNPEYYRNAVAALLALTGEGITRGLIAFSLEPNKWIAIVISRLTGTK